LLSPVKEHCRSVFQAYLRELDGLKLPFHRPERTVIYGKQHWANKSKAPYRWSGKHWFGCVPWLQFVGYQIRYDGLMRPKPDSAKKEVKKLKKKTSELKYQVPHKYLSFGQLLGGCQFFQQRRSEQRRGK